MAGRVISIAPYLKERRAVRVESDGRWTKFFCGRQEVALGPRQVASVLDALRDARERGVGYTAGAGGLVFSGDPGRVVWVTPSRGGDSVALTRRQQNALFDSLMARLAELRGGVAHA
jgi:hypothetical protein